MDIFFHSTSEVNEFVNIVSNMKGEVKLSDERHFVDAIVFRSAMLGYYRQPLNVMTNHDRLIRDSVSFSHNILASLSAGGSIHLLLPYSD